MSENFANPKKKSKNIMDRLQKENKDKKNIVLLSMNKAPQA